MFDGLGIGGGGWLAVAAVVVIGVVALVISVRRRGSGSPEGLDLATLESDRLEVLESTTIDSNRRLVLVRCDNVEHLIMVGGPADVVVENDVGRSRTARSAMRAAAHEAAPRSPAGDLPDSGSGQPRGADAPAQLEPLAAARHAETPRIAAHASDANGRPAQPRQAAAAPRPAIQPAVRNGEAGPASIPPAARAASASPVAAAVQPARPARDGSADRSPPQRAQAQSPAPARREPAVALQPRTPPQPAKVGGLAKEPQPRLQSAPPREAAATVEGRKPAPEAGPAREPTRAGALPVAEIPWPEPDSIEGEIVRALQEPLTPTATDQAQETADDQQPAPELGDLADRLEEALALEVQAAGRDRRRAEPAPDAFAFDQIGPTPRRDPPVAPVEPKRAARTLTAAPDAEPRREARPAERQEEAPVINLNTRRREAADPLEDEMARLLGELTGDTSRR